MDEYIFRVDYTPPTPTFEKTRSNMEHLWNQVDDCHLEIDHAVETLFRLCLNNNDDTRSAADLTPRNTPQPLISLHAPREAHCARKSILANTTKLQHMLRDPAEFLQQITFQTQLLACLQWLGDFQVLGCIPLSHNVPFQDVAELAGVPEAQLTRIVRMTATAGFLCQPCPGHVAHSALSAQFVLNPPLLDAMMFMSETAVPTSLKMISTTRVHGDSHEPTESAYNVTSGSPFPFATACEQRPKLQRQSVAFDRLTAHGADDAVTDLLLTLGWASLGEATVVDARASSTTTAKTLTDLYPCLRFIVQMRKSGSKGSQPISLPGNCLQEAFFTSPAPSILTTSKGVDEPTWMKPRIIIQEREIGTPQAVDGAEIYILRISSASTTVSLERRLAQIVSELRAHLPILHANPTSMLIVVACLIPEPGILDPEVEATASLRDLSLHQLASQKELGMKEFIELINDIQDDAGRLVVVHKLIQRRNPAIAFGVKFQAYSYHSVSEVRHGFWTS